MNGQKNGTILGAALLLLAGLTVRAIAEDSPPAAPAPQLDPAVMGTALTMLITYLVNLVVDRFLPDDVVRTLSDRWKLTVVGVVGTAVAAVQSGQIDVSTGAQGIVIGALAVLVHQVAKKFGLTDAVRLGITRER